MSSIPVIHASGDNLPAAWEKSLIALWEAGCPMETEYDHPGDPLSRDATMIVEAADPLAEPRLHRGLPGGLDELFIYVAEVVQGVHDHWIDPEHGKWSYTYHERMAAYGAGQAVTDQLSYLVEKLSQAPHSRRAQAITWKPWCDPADLHPPCLQRIWCRLVPHQGGWALNMNTHWRSRDAFKGAFMNMFALVELQKMLAGQLAQRLAAPVSLGRYVDISDSYHLYGSYFRDPGAPLSFQGFLKMLEQRDWPSRTYRSDHPAVLESRQAAEEKLAAERAEVSPR